MNESVRFVVVVFTIQFWVLDLLYYASFSIDLDNLSHMNNLSHSGRGLALIPNSKNNLRINREDMTMSVILVVCKSNLRSAFVV